MTIKSDDEKLRRWGVRLQKQADKALAEGRISITDYRDISWHALQATRPSCVAKVTGLSTLPAKIPTKLNTA